MFTIQVKVKGLKDPKHHIGLKYNIKVLYRKDFKDIPKVMANITLAKPTSRVHPSPRNLISSSTHLLIARMASFFLQLMLHSMISLPKAPMQIVTERLGPTDLHQRLLPMHLALHMPQPMSRFHTARLLIPTSA